MLRYRIGCVLTYVYNCDAITAIKIRNICITRGSLCLSVIPCHSCLQVSVTDDHLSSLETSLHFPGLSTDGVQKNILCFLPASFSESRDASMLLHVSTRGSFLSLEIACCVGGRLGGSSAGHCWAGLCMEASPRLPAKSLRVD